MNEPTQLELLHKMLTAILETVREMPDGAPCGPMYQAFLSYWPNMTSDQFNRMCDVLVQAGKVRRSGHVLYAVTP